MMDFINTAKGLRNLKCYVPDHIPDRAVIPQDGIEFIYINEHLISSPYPMPILAQIRLDLDKFTWEPYRRPTNARLLVSRNKREGRFNTVRGGSKRTGPTIGALYLDGKKIGLVKSISPDNETLDEPCSGLGAFTCWG